MPRYAFFFADAPHSTVDDELEFADIEEAVVAAVQSLALSLSEAPQMSEDVVVIVGPDQRAVRVTLAPLVEFLPKRPE